MHHPAGFERYIEEAQQLAARQGTDEEWTALTARFGLKRPCLAKSDGNG
jgi:hypothetical protein